MKFSPSPIQKATYNKKQYLIKRDDLLHPDFSGNKARKFQYYFNNLPPNITTISSYGGNQSNAMYSLSAFAKLKKLKFIYYTRPLPTYLLRKPSGNYLAAIKNGMQICQIQNKEQIPTQPNTFFIRQGGAEPYAEEGVKQLAIEIEQYAHQNNIQQLDIFLSSGTGATALYLQKNSKFNIYTTPCVGDETYLRQQFAELEPNTNIHPKIFNPPHKYHFGTPYPEFYQTWQQVQQQTNIPFDLLYDPQGWMVLDQHRKQLGTNIMYIHCGGLMGNETMEARYRYKKMI